MKKEFIKSQRVKVSQEELDKINQLLSEIKNDEEKNPEYYNQFKPVENEDYMQEYVVIVETDNLVDVKNELKDEIIKQGYKSVDNFAKQFVKGNSKYKMSTIKMGLTENHKTSEEIISTISEALGFAFRRQYQLEKKPNNKVKAIGEIKNNSLCN